MLKGDVYKVGDNVVVSCDAEITPTLNVGDWKVKLNCIFSLQYQGDLRIFFGANYYRQQISSIGGSKSLEIDSTIGMSVHQSRFMPFTWNSIRPIECLLHKFIPFQHGSHVPGELTMTVVWYHVSVREGGLGREGR